MCNQHHHERHTMPPIPDHPDGTRYCRQCSSFLPVTQFHGGRVRRFECKKHALERFCRYRKNAKPDADRRAVARVWHALWADSKMIFGRQKAGLTQADVRRLFDARGMQPDLSWRVVPRNPDCDWTCDNAPPWCPGW